MPVFVCALNGSTILDQRLFRALLPLLSTEEMETRVVEQDSLVREAISETSCFT
jgi:hypothetical protein